MERAFHELGRHAFEGKDEERRSLVRTYGLRPELLAVTQVWQDDNGLLVAAKGAPEAIAGLCRASTDELAAVKASVDAMATEGLRVLGVARARTAAGSCRKTRTGLAFEYVGLVGLADPLRASVRDAVAECRFAGIRVVMITGDYPATARAIARQAGLESLQIMTGEELERYVDAELAQHVQAVTVFARIMPEQKLRIVNALKANGEIVAMTGDGVNDAPSLKAAHIGIAMGGRGTDVAREASSIVLLDDDFGSVVKAVRLGRRIYDNLRKAMAFIFAVHVPIAGLALLPLIFGLPIIFSPIHIAFLEMVIDPVCTLVFEAETEEDDIMRRPPRAPDEPLFSTRLILWSVLQGLTGVRAGGSDLRDRLSARHAGGRGAGARLLLAGNDGRRADLREPQFQRIDMVGPAAAQSRPQIRALGCGRHTRAYAGVAGRQPPISLRPAACGRSCIDGGSGVCGACGS